MSMFRAFLPGVLVLGLLGAGRAAGAGVDGAKLVGVWEEVRGEIPARTTVEFTADHKVRLMGRLPDGQQGSIEGSYDLEGTRCASPMSREQNNVTRPSKCFP
jgi:uncharacterized protein (TIGR03066 family)